MTTVTKDIGREAPAQHEIEERVLVAVRELARELGGDRAASAVTPTASLERDVGLGSLERVELLMRLQSELGRELGDRFLVMDTPREIALAIPSAPAFAPGAAVPRAVRPHVTTLNAAAAPTLVEALRLRALGEPLRVHALLDSDSGMQPLTYGELWDGAARIAASLIARGVKPAETVAIMLPTSADYLESFMGVLAAGAVAVPLYPPARLDRLEEYLVRQARILANAQARVMIAMPEAAPVARMLHRAAPAVESIVTAEALRRDGSPGEPVTRGPHDPALVQYTSGSTGDPKGVLLTNANLLANMRAIAAAIALVPTDVAVSWLPLYHDMGLIGTWLNTMVHGIPITLMSPLSFLARPDRWLWAIHQQRATVSAAPNFAYELCVRKIRDDALAGLDLSSWRLAANGSEPVSAATLDRFARRFEPYGFRAEALVPMYGLAESAVALCVPPLGRAPVVDSVDRDAFSRDGRARRASRDGGAPLQFVSVGTPLAGHEVRLVDDHGSDVPTRVVGKLVFRGPSCTSGYYRNPEATARALLPGGWLDSGDSAYRDENGEIFITGRVKDLIIKGGRNLVAQEIEDVVGSIDGVRKGCVVAFGVADEATGTERLVVLAESRLTSRADRERLEQQAISRVAAEVGIPPDVVRIVQPGVVPKTPSGKIRRAAARDAYAHGQVGGTPRAPLRLRAGLAFGAATEAARKAAQAVGRALQAAYLIVVWTVALIVLGPIVGILIVALPAGRPVRWLGRAIARVALAISGCRLDVEGAEHLPRRGPVVLVTNHTSYADTPVLLAALAIDFVFVAMKEILSWRILGRFARRGDHLLVDRWHARQSVADAAAVEQRLREGGAVLFFAEGGFSRARGLRPFRLGAFEAAVAAGAPVVPIALRGSRDLLPADHKLPRSGRVHVWIGEPIRPSGAGWAAVIDLRARATDAVAAHCGEPRLEARVAGASAAAP